MKLSTFLWLAAVSGAWGQTHCYHESKEVPCLTIADKGITVGTAPGYAFPEQDTAPVPMAGADMLYWDRQKDVIFCSFNGGAFHPCTDTEIKHQLAPKKPAARRGKASH
jgi:hypothetical protein